VPFYWYLELAQRSSSLAPSAQVPETNANSEVGIEQALLGDRLFFGVSLFKNRYKNLVDFDTTSSKLVNRPPITAEGVEGEARWSPLPGLNLGLQVTYASGQRTTVDERAETAHTRDPVELKR
jgi:outer membrane receptor protein involved in Fe transport